MAQVITLQEVQAISVLLKKEHKTIVLVGGCFDVLHVGHVKFIREAKKFGTVLILLLESDEIVKKLKGKNRPLFTQKERAEVLLSIDSIDYIVRLPTMETDQNYEDIVLEIKPDIIAFTENDPNLEKKKHQAEKVGGEVRIIPYVKTFSSSKLARLLGIE